jgi:hypothetical protein
LGGAAEAVYLEVPDQAFHVICVGDVVFVRSR